MKIVTSEQMRQIEQACAGIGLPAGVLMENAGRAVAAEVQRRLGDLSQQHILLLIGPGNNGGDGLVAARHLHDRGAQVSLYLCHHRTADANLEAARQRGITIIEAEQDAGQARFAGLLSPAGCVIDAIFGTGRVRPLEGVFRAVLEGVAAARRERKDLRVIAVDVPSGLNADSGAVDPACPRADYTITLGFPKPGLFIFPGAEHTGEVTVADIGIPAGLAEASQDELITAGWARAALPRRPLDANKGSFGRVLTVAGSASYVGAAYLAGSGAVRVGAGLVTLATPASLHPILAAKLTEATFLPLPESPPGTVSPQAAETVSQQFGQYNVLLLGCGLGQSPSAMKFIGSLFLKPGLPQPVLDADALNTLAKVPRWWQELGRDAILTPHPGEMARLCGLTVEEVQSDRMGIARRMAQQWHKTVVLKGAFTVIAAPDGRCRLNPSANPGLASAGTGDVLAGAIAGLLAQGLPLFDAAALGVYLHSRAGEMVRDRLGDAGTTAGDLLPELPLAIKQLKGD